jgi:glycosyltransferase involved in cell wall biosynthesis
MIRRRPTVSIGLPVYNGQRYLAETINAILTQSLSKF